MKFFLWLSGLIICFLLALPVQAVGFEVFPARIKYSIKPGSSMPGVIKIVNKGEAFKATFDKANFTFSGENGQPKFIFSSPNESHTLREWMKLPESILIPENSEEEIFYTISVPEDAPAGGYYGAVFVQQVISEASDKTVKSLAQVASLVLVTVEGEFEESAEVSDFFLSENDSGEKILIIRFKNTGNVHLQPLGTITFLDEEEKILVNEDNREYKILVNKEEEQFVLPGQIRRFEVVFPKEYEEKIHSASLFFSFGTKNLSLQENLILKGSKFSILIILVIAGLVFLGIYMKRKVV